MTPLRAVKGMNDVLPGEARRFREVEAAFRDAMERLGYGEVRTPYVEPTGLFVRTIGETTDVVEKEMYSFRHRDDELTLRPEGTAGAARAYVEHKIHNQEPITRWYYLGPMFRAERPQRGRYRQFSQVGAEVYGDPGPACDAEMIDALTRFLRAIGVSGVEVLLGSIGGPATRASYREALVRALAPIAKDLSEDSQRRLGTNPLRILDSKDPRDREAVARAPALEAHLAPEDRAHFDALRRHLDALGTAYTVDATLVRGLDYYTRTLFEIRGAADKLGAGSTLVGGGRYDGMVKDLGGPDVPAIGFAAGLERLVIASDAATSGPSVDVLVAPIGDAAIDRALVIGRDLRERGARCEVDARGASVKSMLRRANALGARAAILVGERELADGVAELKDLASHAQERVRFEELVTATLATLARPVPEVGT